MFEVSPKPWNFFMIILTLCFEIFLPNYGGLVDFGIIVRCDFASCSFEALLALDDALGQV